MRIIIYTVVLASLLATFSCRTTKKINTAIAKKDTTELKVVEKLHIDSAKIIKDFAQKIQQNKIDFNTFSAKMKVDYWDKDGKGPELTVLARIKKDSIIWLSINATVFSFEAFRVLITPDSVMVMNKKDKIIQYRSISYLQDLVKIPFDFSTLQDLIVGNPIFFNNNIISYKTEPSAITLFSKGEFFKHLLTVLPGNMQLQHSKLDDINEIRHRTCDLTYGNYEQLNNINFSRYRSISLTEKSKLDVQMDFKQYSFNEILSYPFKIPKNFRRQ